MALLRDSATDGERLARYLLGLLPDDEAECLDEQSVVDDGVACRLLSAENDLVDAYVRGTLPPDRRLRFESHYMASPRRRKRVAFARRFLAAVDRSPQPALAPPRWLTWSTFVRPSLAAAAALIVAVGLLAAQNLSLRSGLTGALRAGAAHDRRAQELSAQLEASRASNAQLAKAVDEAQSVSSMPSVSQREPLSIAPTAVVLVPQMRSLGSLPTLSVAEAGFVPFELRLESRDFPHYRATLRDQDTGRVIWHSLTLTPRSSAAAVVPLLVPAPVLKPPHRFAFELAGVDAAGREEALGSYVFQIDPR